MPEHSSLTSVNFFGSDGYFNLHKKNQNHDQTLILGSKYIRSTH